MSVSDIDAAIRLIDGRSDGANFEGKKPDSLIARAEAALGAKFPEDYRYFLRTLGAGISTASSSTA